MVLSKGEVSGLPEQYKQCLEDLHDSLDTIIQTLSKVEDKTWRKKLAGVCMLALGTLEFPEVSLQETSEEDQRYIG